MCTKFIIPEYVWVLICEENEVDHNQLSKIK